MFLRRRWSCSVSMTHGIAQSASTEYYWFPNAKIWCHASDFARHCQQDFLYEFATSSPSDAAVLICCLATWGRRGSTSYCAGRKDCWLAATGVQLIARCRPATPFPDCNRSSPSCSRRNPRDLMRRSIILQSCTIGNTLYSSPVSNDA